MAKRGKVRGIYPVRESLEAQREIIKRSELSQETKGKILEFLDKCVADGLTLHRVNFYATYLKQIARMMGRAFINPTKKDMEKMVAEVNSRDYEEWTKYSYKTATKRFYKWLLGNDEEYPDCVKWIKLTVNGANKKLPKDLLTKDEIQALIKAAHNSRDAALVSLLADSGCRIGEILTLAIRDIEFDRYGLVLHARGKTGERRVRVIGDSISYVAAWLENHPAGNDRDSPLFVGVNLGARGKIMTYAQVRKVLEQLKKRAGIKKRIHPHLFRHTKATELATSVPEAPLEAHMGWVHGSRQTQVYVHLSGRDTDKVILKAHGIEVEEEKKEREHVRVCPRCNVTNASAFQFCRHCGLPLAIEVAIKMEDSRQREMDVNPSLEVMRREILRLERELERLAQLSASQGRSS